MVTWLTVHVIQSMFHWKSMNPGIHLVIEAALPESSSLTSRTVCSATPQKTPVQGSLRGNLCFCLPAFPHTFAPISCFHSKIKTNVCCMVHFSLICLWKSLLCWSPCRSQWDWASMGCVKTSPVHRGPTPSPKDGIPVSDDPLEV